MKKKRLVASFIGVIILVLVVILQYQPSNNTILKSENNMVVSENTLTMMYETEADSGEYQVSSDTTWPQDGYVFNESLSSCENGSTLSWDDENKRVLMQANTSDKCYVYFDKKPDIVYLADYIINSVYTGVDGENGLYYHDGVGSYTNADQEAGDNSYRYSGANPNNYVCFGSDAASCPSANLYRIIGVFGNEVKLIKSTSYGNYVWDSGNSNTWNPYTKTYPDIRTTLNSTFMGTLSSAWQNKIATHAYKVGGMARDDSATAKEYYNTEVGSSSSSTTDSMKIGLMYVSDYGFAASPDYWTTELNNYEPSKSSNWLAGLNEWTISRSSESTVGAFRVRSAGWVNDSSVNSSYAVRPVFYLTSATTYVSGSGTSSDPIRIN